MGTDEKENLGSESKPSQKATQSFRETNDALGLGLQIAVSIVFFSLGGYWLDKNLNTFPLFLIIGIIFGLIGMIVLMIKISNPQKK